MAGAERSAWLCRREPLRRLVQINRVGRGEESRRLIVRIGIASQPQSAPSLDQAERRPPCRDQKDPLRQREISCSTSLWVQPFGIVARGFAPPFSQMPKGREGGRPLPGEPAWRRALVQAKGFPSPASPRRMNRAASPRPLREGRLAFPERGMGLSSHGLVGAVGGIGRRRGLADVAEISGSRSRIASSSTDTPQEGD